VLSNGLWWGKGAGWPVFFFPLCVFVSFPTPPEFHSFTQPGFLAGSGPSIWLTCCMRMRSALGMQGVAGSAKPDGAARRKQDTAISELLCPARARGCGGNRSWGAVGGSR